MFHFALSAGPTWSHVEIFSWRSRRKERRVAFSATASVRKKDTLSWRSIVLAFLWPRLDLRSLSQRAMATSLLSRALASAVARANPVRAVAPAATQGNLMGGRPRMDSEVTGRRRVWIDPYPLSKSYWDRKWNKSKRGLFCGDGLLSDTFTFGTSYDGALSLRKYVMRIWQNPQ